MGKEHSDSYNEPISYFDVWKEIKDISNCTSEDIAKAIKKLRQARYEVKKREEEAHVKEVTCMDLPMDWENIFNTDPRTQGVHTESISDALVLCLNALGRVDIEYISSITGANYKSVISTLKGSIYQNPETWNECFYKGWETAEEYLSGNLMRKWKSAKKADRNYMGYFADNIKAIEKVLPPTVVAKDIYITLGSPWVPPDIIDDFIVHLFGQPYVYNDDLKTIHDDLTGTWEIPYKLRYAHNTAICSTYGTEKMGALNILKNTLNMKTAAVTKMIPNPSSKSGKKCVIDKAETIIALEKQQKLIKTFQSWVWSDKNRKERLEIIFENKFGCVRRRSFDGSFLTLPDISPTIKLFPYQKDAVARIIFTPNTLLAHDVGSGKTYVMIVAGHELRRMGLSKKNMYVVPNNIVRQWRNIYLSIYPNSKILCVEPKTFTPDKRKDVLKQIRYEDFDGIIIAYSCFEQIPLSTEYYLEDLNHKKEQVSKLLQWKDTATSKLKKKNKALEKALSEIALVLNDLEDTICFDKLGITRLFIDEAHNFKNVPIETQIKSVLGINGKGSKKCKDMLDKIHMIQKANDGKGVVLATATPITNSVTDAFVMQQFLQNGELSMLEIQSFDSWIGMFAERVTEFEIDVDTNNYRLATRFSKFHNLPELTALLASFVDFHQIDASAGIPAHDGYIDVLVSKTNELSDYLKSISQRAEYVRHGTVNRKEDNMLKITTDGRKAALDIRLVKPDVEYSYTSKVSKCVENVANIYYRNGQNKSTQLIFCDTSTPKASFNIYSELKDRLIMQGIPKDKIAFIHDAETETKRTKLFSAVRSGDIRILIGSTFKLGLGVNIQDRLIAIHHLDITWRPADMTQREGRILRQGNMNKKVYIYRYIIEGSFDAYSWQLLETKQHFISDLLSGTLTERSGSNIENTVLDYAEVKALAVGNPLIKERVEAQNELTRYMILQRKQVESRIKLETELLELPGKIERQKKNIRDCESDICYCKQWKNDNPAPTEKQMKEQESQHRKALRELLNNELQNYVSEIKEKILTSYRGFDIVLPTNMTDQKPFVWLVRQGRYYVELGNTEIGNLVRIDNYLDTLDEHIKNLKSILAALELKQSEIKKELSVSESYSNQIKYYKNKVKSLDKQLGVENNE